MEKDPWLPKGYKLTDGSKIKSLLYSGDKWQIFDITGSSNILLTRAELAQRWFEVGFLNESLFEEFTFGTERFWSLICKKKYTLAPVSNGKSPENKVDGLAFALALKESRKLSNDVFFHDAIYVEQYSRLLPNWTLTPHFDDKVVLGTWITGGVVISTESFRRLTTLTGWMPATDLIEIIRAAGFTEPADAALLANWKSASHTLTNSETSIANESPEPEKLELQKNTIKSRVFKLPGRPELEDFFNEHIIDIIFNAQKYQAMGIEFPSAIVLHGPPGCGKTYAVEQLVEFIDWPCYTIDSSSIGSPYIHETSRKISEVFEKAINNAPSVIVIDEMESLLSERHSNNLSGLYHNEEVAEFLRQIPEANKNKVLVIAMTNMIEVIDPAILRRGRFDHIIKVGMPSREEVVSLINSLLSQLPKAEHLNMNKVFDTLTGRALSDSAFVIREAARLAAKYGKVQIDQMSIEAAINSLPSYQEKKRRPIGFFSNE